MADENNEDSWLYGSGEKKPEGDPAADAAEEPEEGEIDSTSKDDEKNEEPAAGGEDAIEEKEEGCPNAADEMEEQDGAVATTQPGAERDDENSEDSDEDDDDINVVIGNIKSGPSYNIKQRGGTAAGSAPAGTTAEKAAKQASGKFNIEEFESIGTISGVPAHEFSIDSLDEKPWRKPGADITDYFNYGFNEETWRMYCERQKRMRQSESGAGLQGLMVHTHQQQQQITVANAQMQHNSVPAGRTLTPIANDNSKYGTQPMPISMINRRQAGPPPGRRLTGVIDVIGGNGMSEGGRPGGGPTKGPGTENAIQVMTAERREYSRPGMPPNVGGKFDMPPPTTIGFPGSGGGGGPPPVVGPNPNHPPHSNSSGAPPLMDPFFEPDAYNYGYEPTQDSQWGPQGNPGWMPTGIKELTPGPPQMVPPPMNMGIRPQHQIGGMPMGMPPPGGAMNNPMSRFPASGDRSERERRDRSRDRRERSEHRSSKSEREREETDRDRSRASRSSKGDRDRDDTDRERRSRRSRSKERSRRRSPRDKERSDKDKDRERERREKKDKKREKEDSE